MALDHEAIYKVYSDCVRIDDSLGAFKADGSQITLVQSNIDAARVELDKTKYKRERTISGSTIYASFGDQLDMLYADMLAGKLDTTGTWATHIKAVKDANPKPS